MKLNRRYWGLRRLLHARAGEVWRQIQDLESSAENLFEPDGQLVIADPFTAVRVATLREEYWWLADALDNELWRPTVAPQPEPGGSRK